MRTFCTYLWLFIDVVCAVVGLCLLPSEPTTAFGWSLHGPVVFCIIRLVWLLLVILARCGHSRPQASVPSKVLQEAFPYVAYVPLIGACLARLVSDPPAVSNGLGFWTFVVLGFLSSAVEIYFTLPALTRLRSTERPGSESNLDIELLSDAGIAASTTSDTEQRTGQKKDSVWKLLRLVAKEWPLLIQAFIFLVIAAIADVLIPHYISQTISQIIRAEEQGTLASRPYKGPVIRLLVAAGASSVFSACRGATFIVIGGRLAERLRCTLFATLMQQEIGFFDTTQIGELTSRMTQDCQQVVEQAYLNVNVFLRTLVSIITTLIFMFSITQPLTFVAFVSVPAVVAISMKYSSIFQKISEEAQKSLADANAVANESLGNMILVGTNAVFSCFFYFNLIYLLFFQMWDTWFDEIHFSHVFTSRSTIRSFAAETLEHQRFGIAIGVYR